MTSRGSEELKAALRRSLRLIVLLIIVGVVVVNLFEQIKGPSYQAVSKVEVAATPLSEVITNTEPTFVDPQRSQDTAAALAASPQVYEIARAQTNGRLGSAGTLQGAIAVTEVTDTDILAFTATASSASKAQQIANAVAAGYETFSARNASQSIVSTIAKLRATLTTLSAGSQRTQLQGELNRLQLLQGATASDATIVQQAVSADQTSPAVVKDTALGLVIGLVVALIVVAIREAVDTRVRSDRDAEELLSVPVIGRLRPLPKRVKLVSFGTHQSLFSDAYALLAAQLAPPRDATEAKVIAMTSAVAQEGKTSTSANLAVAMARRGADVILVDFDFRKPEMGNMFNLPKDARGALQVFSARATIANALWDIKLNGMQPQASQNGSTPPGPPSKGLGRLRVMPAGGTVSPEADGRPVTLPLAQLLAQLRERAEIIIVDTSPALLTADMTDFAGEVDAVVAVVRQGYASKRNVRMLAQYTESWHTDLAGTILTGVPLPPELATYYGSR